MIPPEIVFLTPHLLERATRPVLEAPALPGGAVRALRALAGALRVARVPLAAALIVAALTWGTPGAAVAIVVAAIVLAIGFAMSADDRRLRGPAARGRGAGPARG
jgi:hypothetical protein